MSDQYHVDVSTLTFKQLKKIRAYLSEMVKRGGSDLHVKAGSQIRTRIDGNLVKFSKEELSHEDSLTLAKEFLKGRFAEFVKNKEVDFVYPFDENSRFRVNMFFQVDGVSAVFRVIPLQIPTFEELKLPEVVRSFTKKERGLILVTGITGSGKSTTLATMINEINENKRKHIITIEDPVEFVHKDKECIINQRSVGQDTLSFKNALRGALREDPDIILVGEMRDRETIELALHAADTGHLVFSTLHTLDARETINRIIAQFPTEEQNRVRLAMSGVLGGIISQRLVPTKDGKRRAAMEILVKTPTIEQLILENRDYDIHNAIEKGKEHYKSQTFDQALLELYQEGVIYEEDALSNATSASDLKLRMSGLQGADSAYSEEIKEDIKIDVDDADVFDLK